MKMATLPSVDSRIKPAKQAEPVQQPAATKAVQEAEKPYEGYVSRRLDTKLTREAAIKLRDKTRHLQDIGAKTADGRFVTNKTQAIQWIIENEVTI